MFRYYARFCEIDGQPGGQYDIIKVAYEVDKTLTSKENSSLSDTKTGDEDIFPNFKERTVYSIDSPYIFNIL